MDRAELLEALTQTLGERSFGGWSGMYGGLPVAPDQSWPFRTKAADRVWELVVELMPLHPEMGDLEIIRMAVFKSGIPGADLTPEDWRLLEMATEWYRNGTQNVPKPRIGGMPGGPADHTVPGEGVPKRGLP